MTEIHRLSASALAEAIARGSISARAALDHYLARIERRGEPINAVVVLNAESARERADAADAALAAGDNWGPLHGVPMTVKDSYEVLGFTTVVGEPKLADYNSQRNATAVQRLLDAGAVVFGKTNTPRLAQDVQTYNPVYGTPHNRWNTQRTSGGPAGGAAAALAAGFTPLELGSDLAGSIRTPCNWCGVYGHKPSYGLVPMFGQIPGPPGARADPDLCVAGPMARSAPDLALAMDILAGPAAPDGAVWRVELPEPKPRSLTDFRVACYFDSDFAPVAGSIKTKLRDTAGALETAGVDVTWLNDLPDGLEKTYTLYDQLLNGLVGAGLPAKLYKKISRSALFYNLFGRTEMGTLGGFAARAAVSHYDWAKANEARHKLRQTWHAFFADYDVVLLPVAPVSAIAHDHSKKMFERKIQPDGQPRPYTDLFHWIAPATTAGLPATSAPIGVDDDNLPVGLQIVADYGQDKTAIAFAGHLAQLIGGFAAPPDYA